MLNSTNRRSESRQATMSVTLPRLWPNSRCFKQILRQSSPTMHRRSIVSRLNWQMLRRTRQLFRKSSKAGYTNSSRQRQTRRKNLHLGRASKARPTKVFRSFSLSLSISRRSSSRPRVSWRSVSKSSQNKSNGRKKRSRLSNTSLNHLLLSSRRNSSKPRHLSMKPRMRLMRSLPSWISSRKKTRTWQISAVSSRRSCTSSRVLAVKPLPLFHLFRARSMLLNLKRRNCSQRPMSRRLMHNLGRTKSSNWRRNSRH